MSQIINTSEITCVNYLKWLLNNVLYFVATLGLQLTIIFD